MYERLNTRSKEYAAIHQKIKNNRGVARKQKCSACIEPAWNWAWIHNTDPTDIHNYTPLCATHHYYYDEQQSPKIGSGNGNSILNEQQVIIIRELYKSGEWTHQELAEHLDVSRSTISHAIRQRTWSHVDAKP
jgi:hypothetical protein